MVVFSTDLGTRQTSHDRDLTYVGEGIGNGPLEDLFGRVGKGGGGGQEIVESRERRKESVCVG